MGFGAWLNTHTTLQDRKAEKSRNGHGNAGFSFSDFIGLLAQAAESSTHSFEFLQPESPCSPLHMPPFNQRFQQTIFDSNPVVNFNFLANPIMGKSVLSH